MWRATAILAILCGVMLFTFQNCAGGGEEEDTSNSSKDQDKLDAAPFAFDVTTNELSYLTCTQSGQSTPLDPAIFYTFKLGAYTKFGNVTGVRVRDDFFSYADSNYKAPYGSGTPEGQASVDQISNLLGNSANNKGSQLQLAVRSRTQLQTIDSTAATPKSGSDYFDILAEPLTSTTNANLLARSRGQTINYFNSGSGLAGKLIEGRVAFTTNALIEETIRQDLSSQYLLALTYKFDTSQGAADYAARAPASEIGKTMGKVYGRGYVLAFAQADSRFSMNPSRVLQSVSELDLGTDLNRPAAGATWDCPTNYRYMVVEMTPTDLRNQYCPVSDSTTWSTSQKAEVEVIKKHVKSEDFDINPVKRCIVPKKAHCYGGTVPVAYDTSQACGSQQSKDCAHFFSLCTRRAP
jgi:hypothetical protein